MSKHLGLRFRFWFETVVGLASTALFLVTLLQRQWIEVAFGVDPDRASSSLEWMLVAMLFTVALVSASLARREWQRSVSVAI